MSELACGRMTSDEFIAWAVDQPETEHYELIDGEAVAIAPGRSRHRPCRVYPDGILGEVDDHTVYEPDAFIRRGALLFPGATKVTDPVITVDLLPLSSSSRDVGPKLMDYVRLPPLHHSLIVPTENRAIVHHERDENSIILIRIVRDGPIVMDPPGIALANCFPPGVA